MQSKMKVLVKDIYLFIRPLLIALIFLVFHFTPILMSKNSSQCISVTVCWIYELLQDSLCLCQCKGERSYVRHTVFVV